MFVALRHELQELGGPVGALGRGWHGWAPFVFEFVSCGVHNKLSVHYNICHANLVPHHAQPGRLTQGAV